MFLTRLGYGSKAVITGDVTQIDLPAGRAVRPEGGAARSSPDIDGIRFCELHRARRRAPPPGAGHHRRLRPLRGRQEAARWGIVGLGDGTELSVGLAVVGARSVGGARPPGALGVGRGGERRAVGAPERARRSRSTPEARRSMPAWPSSRGGGSGGSRGGRTARCGACCAPSASTAELSVALVDDAEMRALNLPIAAWIDRPMSWPSRMREGNAVAADAGACSAMSSSRSIRRRDRRAARGAPDIGRVRTLLTHGVLHLLGYDHERSPVEARRMFAKQRWLLARSGRVDLPRRAARERCAHAAAVQIRKRRDVPMNDRAE